MTETALARQLPTWPLVCVWLLVVASVITWRQGVIFSGGLDFVVVAKAAVAGLAIVLAGILAATARQRRRVGGISIGFIAIIVAISVLGSLAGNEVPAAGVLALRILLLAGTILMVIRVYPAMTILATLLAAMTAVGLFAAATGYRSYLASGRLSGGIPPLAPNELAALLLPPMVGTFYYMVQRRVRWWNVVLLIVLMGATYATGSRTGLAVMALSIVLVLVFARSLHPEIVIPLLLLVPIAYVVLGFTDLLDQVVSRGEDPSQLMTLNARTLAWDAVLSTPVDSWQWWIGAGLAMKKIAVAGQYWDEQVLDSSWISILAQAGVIGAALFGALVLFTIGRSLRPTPLRGIAAPMLVLIVVRSILENGLVESSTTFALFFTIAVLLEPGTREHFVPVPSHPHATGWRSPAPGGSIPLAARGRRLKPSTATHLSR